MHRISNLIAVLLCTGCFADIDSSGTSGATDGTDTDSASGSTTVGTSGDSTSTTTQGGTSGVSGTGGTSGGQSSDGGSSGSSTGETSETSGSTGGAGSTSGVGSTGGAGPQWSECIDSTVNMANINCDARCGAIGLDCVEQCGPNNDAGIEASWDSPTCDPPYTNHDLCDQNVIGFIRCCCV